VLPFTNLSGDPEQEYFVDGVTESLTTDLSRSISGSFVIGRHTAFTYKGKAVDLRQIGRDLNVRYVLEGSVQRRGDRLRVNVQLLDAETGAHLWADRFDKPISDLFDMQDEIVSRLANTLDTQLIEAEARRAERSSHPNSMDLYFQGRGLDGSKFKAVNNRDTPRWTGAWRGLRRVSDAICSSSTPPTGRSRPRHLKPRRATSVLTPRAASSLVNLRRRMNAEQKLKGRRYYDNRKWYKDMGL
jgi:TolB-like protein